MRVFFSNLGCKLNQAEIESLAREFTAAGYPIVSDLAEADLHVVNSCTVTHVAARDSRKIARRGQRLNTELKTVLTGCYVNGSPDEAAALAGVDLVVPNEFKRRLLAEIESAFPEARARRMTDRVPDLPYLPPDVLNTRALVKIEDGCNMPCAFCVIPATRGRQRSRPLSEIVEEVRDLDAAGHREIVITGVQISSYRREGKGLFELVSTLLEETRIPRLRLTSIAPWQFDERLLDLFDTGRVCRHFHLSLQSGCDRTLGRMRRPYTTESFARLLDGIRGRLPEVAITTDVIVGFPGETERDFSQSLAFVERQRFAMVHAFPYSSRPGTEASEMGGQISHQTKRARMQQMLALGERSKRDFWRQQLGTTAEVLWERPGKGHWLGLTDHYIRVISYSSRTANELGPARLDRIDHSGVVVAPSPPAVELAKTTYVHANQEAADSA